jgi:hypothetical protein
MKLDILKGTTSKRLAIFIQNSSLTTGAGLAGLVFNSAGLTWYYWREDEGNAGATVVTLATATRGTFASGGFVEKDATNMPGLYEIGIPDAALAAGAGWVVMVLKGATNMAPVVLEIQLVNYNPQDGVRLGLTALPNAAAEAAGGLYTRGTGAGQINQPANGNIDANVKTWLSGAIPAPAITGVPIVDWKYVLGTILTEGGAGRLAAAIVKLFDVAAPVLTAASVNQTGDSFARLGAPAGASVSVDVAAVKTDTAAIKAKTDNLPASPAAVGSAMALTGGERDSVADALLDRASGIETSWTLRQALRILLAALGGKLSGAATATVLVRDVGDTKNRITATVDASGNRSAVTLDNS